MKPIASPISRESENRRSSTCAWVETSRPETTSSASTKSGSSTTARAMPTRWALAAGEPAWGGVAVERRRGKPHAVERAAHAPLGGGPVGLEPVQQDRLDQDAADRVARVERGHRVLEDHLHASAQPPQRLVGEGREVRPVESARRPRSAARGRAARGRALSCPSRTRRRCRRSPPGRRRNPPRAAPARPAARRAAASARRRRRPRAARPGPVRSWRPPPPSWRAISSSRPAMTARGTGSKPCAGRS